MKKEVRIVERLFPDGKISYVIQQKHFLIPWLWVDAWVNALEGASCNDSYQTLQEAKDHLPFFNGTKVIDKVV